MSTRVLQTRARLNMVPVSQSTSVWSSGVRTILLPAVYNFRLLHSTACIPSVAPGKKLGVGVSNSHTWTWGETTHYDTQYTATLPLKAGSERSVRASSLVTQSMVEVPFTMYMSSKRTPRVKVQTTGTWHGICSWDHRLITKDVKHSI